MDSMFLKINLQEVGNFMRTRQTKFPNTVQFLKRTHKGENLVDKFMKTKPLEAKNELNHHQEMLKHMGDDFLVSKSIKAMLANHIEDFSGKVLKAVGKE